MNNDFFIVKVTNSIQGKLIQAYNEMCKTQCSGLCRFGGTCREAWKYNAIPRAGHIFMREGNIRKILSQDLYFVF